MRVLHVTSTFPRHDGDTVGPFLADLVGGERDLGLDVRVLAPHAPGLTSDGEVAGVPVHRFRYGPGRAERLAYGGGLLAEARSVGGAAMVGPYLAGMTAAAAGQVRSWRPDLIHAHWWLPAGAAVAVSGRPFVVTLHGSDVAVGHRRWLRPIGTRVLRRAAAVLAISDDLAGEASDLFGVPVDVAAMPVVVGPDPAHRPTQGPIRLAAVGRLAPEKGFDVLIDAVAAATGVTLDLVGAGPAEADLAAQATRLNGRVRLRGALPRSVYHDIVRSADALVVPSKREGLGLVAVEAVLMGVPVIASAVGGLPSVLAGDGGILVPPGDVDALAAALGQARMLRPPGPIALAAAAADDPAAVAERHRDLYDAVVASRGS